MHRPDITPHKIAGRAAAVPIHQTSFQHEGLLDTAVSVQGQRGSRCHAKHRGESFIIRVVPQDLQLYSGKRCGLPFKVFHVNVVRPRFGFGHCSGDCRIRCSVIERALCARPWPLVARDGQLSVPVLKFVQRDKHESQASELTSPPGAGLTCAACVDQEYFTGL